MEREPENESPYQDGKRAGAHPLVVIFGVIAGIWVLIWFFVPSSKQLQKPSPIPDNPAVNLPEGTDEASVMFKVGAVVPEMNAVSIVVPEQTTTSQLIGLLKRLKEARLANRLSTMLPPTTPGHKLGDHAIADIYIVSKSQYATAEAIKVLSRGAHAPGELYPQAIPFEEAMEQVRGHYRIDMHDLGKIDQASVGFADESGVHSRDYRRIF